MFKRSIIAAVFAIAPLTAAFATTTVGRAAALYFRRGWALQDATIVPIRDTARRSLAQRNGLRGPSQLIPDGG